MKMKEIAIAGTGVGLATVALVYFVQHWQKEFVIPRGRVFLIAILGFIVFGLGINGLLWFISGAPTRTEFIARFLFGTMFTEVALICALGLACSGEKGALSNNSIKLFRCQRRK